MRCTINRFYNFSLLCLVGLILGSAACGPSAAESHPVTGVQPDGTPKWVHRGSGTFDGDSGGKAFFGVGIADGIRNEALARQTADNRARGEIAKMFDLYVAAMMKDYQRSTTAGDFAASAEEQDVVSVQKTITEVSLRGVEVRDHWWNPQSGAVYALAVLDVNAITRSVEGANTLDARVRDHVRANAARAFGDLDRELAKRPAQGGPAAPPEATEPAPPVRPDPEPAPAAEVRDSPAAEVPARLPARVRLGLRIQGTKAPTIQTCFAEELTRDDGLELFENTSDVDVMVKGTLRYAKAGVVGGSQMVNASVELRLSSMKDGQTLAALEEKVKVGRPTLEQAIQTAITQLCKQVAPRMVAELRSRMAH